MMKHMITRQYARDIEMPLAEFTELAGARFFLKAKLESDAELHVAAIYRLYSDGRLVEESNRGRINVSGVPSRYFSDDGIMGLHSNAFQVVAQDLSNAPVACANFTEQDVARLFIQQKLQEDLAAQKKNTYRILKDQKMLEKFEPAKPVVADPPQETAQAATPAKMPLRSTPFNTGAGTGSQRWANQAGEKVEEKEGQK